MKSDILTVDYNENTMYIYVPVKYMIIYVKTRDICVDYRIRRYAFKNRARKDFFSRNFTLRYVLTLEII